MGRVYVTHGAIGSVSMNPASPELSRYLVRSIEKALSAVIGTRTTGSILRLMMTSYGAPWAFAARILITRVYCEVTSGALMDKSEPERVAQPTGGSVVAVTKVSLGALRYNLRLITKLLPAGEERSRGGPGVGAMIEPGLVVVGSVVKVPWPAVPVPWPAVPVPCPAVPVP